jgi:hypothetical protein
LFRGFSAVDFGLWVSNGTAAGTHELTGISGAFTGGILVGLGVLLAAIWLSTHFGRIRSKTP